MKTTSATKANPKRVNSLKPKYRFIYANSKPNRFANRVDPASVAIVLDPDVAQVFKNGKSVNAILRALMTAMPSIRQPKA
jgi:hypothetical protein